MNGHQVKIGKSLVKIFELLLVLLCLGLTLWQIFKGINKYLSFPQGSTLILSKVSTESLPDFTICPGYDVKDQNETFKENCAFPQISFFGLWASQTCPDPEMNYHGIYDVPKLLLQAIRYSNGSYSPRITSFSNFRVYPKNVKPQNIHHVNDLRCYTISLPESIKNTSISKLLISTKESIFMKIHTKGMFFTEGKFIEVLNEMMDADLTYEIFKQINTKDQSCIEDPSYQKDDCIVEQIHKGSLAKFGCTTPYGPIKNRACINTTLMNQAREFYDDKIMADEYQQCPNPCSTITSTFNIRNQVKNPEESDTTALTRIEFPSKVKIIQAYPAYTILSLVAEVGGYVGLFLGVSVLDLKSLISGTYEYLSRIPMNN